MPMSAEMNPIVRYLVIAFILIVPVLVVILQRLPELKELIQQIKNGESPFTSGLPFSQDGKRDIKVCPKCFSVDPPENQFCGRCGAALINDGPKSQD